MKRYQTVEVKLIMLPTEDVICSSNDDDDDSNWTGIY